MTPENELPQALQGLAALGQQGDLNMRPVLLRVLTDLFVARTEHTQSEIVQYGEMALKFIEGVDAATLACVAGKLASHPQAPVALVDRLVLAGEETALVLLRQSSCVSYERLLAVAQWGVAAEACALAERSDLNSTLVAALADRPERDVLMLLARNDAVTFDRTTFQHLVPRVRADRELAALVGRRAPTAEDAAPLFLYVSAEERAEILRRARVADVLGSRRDFARPVDDGLILEIERLAMSGDHASLMEILATEIGCKKADLDEMLADATGEPVAVMLAAIGVTAPIAGRIFMSGALCDATSVRQVHDLVGIVASLSQRAARRLISSMCGGMIEVKRPRGYLPATDPLAAAVPSREGPTERHLPALDRRRGRIAG